MIAVSAAILSLLTSSEVFYMCDLYTIELASGVTLRYTDLDVDVAYGGQTYLAHPIKRGQIKRVRGLEVQTLDVSIFLDATDLIGTLPWLVSACLGALDNARFRLDRAFFTAGYAGAPVGTVNLFTGILAEPEYVMGEARLKAKSITEVLDTQMPSELFQPSCPYTVFVGECGLDPDAWVESGAVLAGSTVLQINCGLTQVAHYFDQGAITFLTGANAGLSRTVKNYVPGILTVSRPWPQTPAALDTFQVWPGCNRMTSHCGGKFNNYMDDGVTLRFGGQLFIPKSTTAV